MSYEDTLRVFAELKPGDRVEVVHDVRVGFRQWTTRITGKVLSKERRRHSLHFDRNYDDKVFSDVLILEKDDGERTTVTLDEFTQIHRIVPAS
ncbi:MAG: hypothetical protein KatS3mg109_0693 [Pirellulaceae bacterium]|nr:MAG: hypothetical protein KatS3mg109_0693 [Pirellulaceae bacterium]GIW95338.1 MAG: hypothetical protein KatS3mg110_3379 [Pirellulaceae bacterium]